MYLYKSHWPQSFECNLITVSLFKNIFSQYYCESERGVACCHNPESCQIVLLLLFICFAALCTLCHINSILNLIFQPFTLFREAHRLSGISSQHAQVISLLTPGNIRSQFPLIVLKRANQSHKSPLKLSCYSSSWSSSLGDADQGSGAESQRGIFSLIMEQWWRDTKGIIKKRTKSKWEQGLHMGYLLFHLSY